MIKIKVHDAKSIGDEFLNGFDRSESVYYAYRKTENGLKLTEARYDEFWDNEDLKKQSQSLKSTVISGGYVVAIHDPSSLRVLAFAALEAGKFGQMKEYVNLSALHVSCESRGLGYGRVLFEHLKSYANDLGIEAFYISASSCENAQNFYRKIGCVEAEEINRDLAEKEPYDVQMEFVLK